MVIRHFGRALVLTLVAGQTLLLAGCPVFVAGAAVGAGTSVATDRRSIGTQTDDRTIQLKILNRFAHQLPKGSHHLEVAVFNKRVLLVGEAQTSEIRRQAQNAAKSIENVAEVINQIAVRKLSSLADRSRDTLTTTKVTATLLREKNLPAHFIKTVTVRGTVYLMGIVTEEEGHHAAQVARTVEGVQQVVKVFEYIQPSKTKKPSPRRPAPVSEAVS